MNILLTFVVGIIAGAIDVMPMPVIALVAKESKKSIPPMVLMSLFLGTLIGVAGQFLNL